MIRSEAEYREALAGVKAGREHLAQAESELRAMGLAADEVERVLGPSRGFQDKLAEEISGYECLRRGDLGPYRDVDHVGILLIAARIAAGLTLRELASRLGCHESQVSRDERNEYHGITAERARQVAGAMGLAIRVRGEFSGDAPDAPSRDEGRPPRRRGGAAAGNPAR